MPSDSRSTETPHLETLGKLAPAIAHDINNLLSGILGYSQIITSDPAAEGLKSCAEEIEKASKRISGLIRLLQVFNKRQFIQIELLDLNQIIHELEKYIRLLVGENIHLVLKESSELMLIRADKSRIRQLLLLLASRMPELMPQGGRILLGTEDIAVVSDAPTMPREVRIRLEIKQNTDCISAASDYSDNSKDLGRLLQKAKQIIPSAGEIVHLCGGRTTYSSLNETGLSLDFYFPEDSLAAPD
jgi:nitrogen-specific signal transduction histidine kinase